VAGSQRGAPRREKAGRQPTNSNDGRCASAAVAAFPFCLWVTSAPDETGSDILHLMTCRARRRVGPTCKSGPTNRVPAVGPGPVFVCLAHKAA
jgi:hypothetical protein